MSELSIRLEGYPEKVQRIADAIEEAFPELITWVQVFDCIRNATIAIEGYEEASMLLQNKIEISYKQRQHITDDTSQTICISGKADRSGRNK